MNVHLEWFSLHRCALSGLIRGISCFINGVGTISCVVTEKNNTRFICYKCDRDFASPEELSVHQATHRTDELPVCSFCNTKFDTFTKLIKHKRHDCPDREWHCRDCHPTVRCINLLQFHVHCIKVHDKDATETGRHRCMTCFGCFHTRQALLNHQWRINKAAKKPVRKRDPEANTQKYSKRVRRTDALSPERKIPCSEEGCDLVFPSVDALRMHKKNQHVPHLSCKKH
ncbi:oocyte zinc finger protein XlCOF7.1-like isoform X2 [Entelurus aequoreus]|uniref:oocyte zinc finger protein XlCOF7.1-like isoform X2 n=1 Tax=Entelurus aequoreus TaxID=161455 RepID=UPI002B1D50B0|nr:oocyte zinc finger protein XlCOF7.1-like isoform X2 [Entelurus aequoreus]